MAVWSAEGGDTDRASHCVMRGIHAMTQWFEDSRAPAGPVPMAMRRRLWGAVRTVTRVW